MAVKIIQIAAIGDQGQLHGLSDEGKVYKWGSMRVLKDIAGSEVATWHSGWILLPDELSEFESTVKEGGVIRVTKEAVYKL